MRLVLLTGKGGVGKTTTAAATAVHAAAGGRKALVVSTDPAHSLADALGVGVGAEPTEVDTGLYAMQVDAQAAFERTWGEVQSYLRGLLQRAGADPLQAEELTVLPGAEEVLALLEVTAQATSGRWDLVVVDCAPTGETLRLLALPEALRWYVERVFPAHRRALRAVRPVLSRVGAAGLPEDGVLEAVERLHHQLGEVREVLTAPSATVRVVLTPEAVVVAEARRTLTALALHGYRVDAVVANRVVPDDGDDPWRRSWAVAQAAQLEVVRRDVAPLPVLVTPYAATEPVGLDALAALGEALLEDHPHLLEPADAPAPALAVERDGDAWLLSLPLPLARREELSLARSGDELVVTVAGQRRVLALPGVLRRCVVGGASLDHGRLVVRFAPDPALWVRT